MEDSFLLQNGLCSYIFAKGLVVLHLFFVIQIAVNIGFVSQEIPVQRSTLLQLDTMKSGMVTSLGFYFLIFFQIGLQQVVIDPKKFLGVHAVADAVEYLHSGRSTGKVWTTFSLKQNKNFLTRASGNCHSQLIGCGKKLPLQVIVCIDPAYGQGQQTAKL